MSYVTIYTVQKDGEVVRYDEAKNNHGFAPLVWQFLTVQYGIHPTGKPYDLTPFWHYEPLWDMQKARKLERLDSIILGVTFDRVWVGRALVPTLIEAMQAFHRRYIVPNDLVPTILDASVVLQEWLAGCQEDRGVAFNMCSADAPFWEVYEDDHRRPYDMDTDPTEGKPAPWELT